MGKGSIIMLISIKRDSSTFATSPELAKAEEKLKKAGITIPFAFKGDGYYVSKQMELLEARINMKYHEMNKIMYKNRLDPAEENYKKLAAYLKRSDVKSTAKLQSKLQEAKSIYETANANYQEALAGYRTACDEFFGQGA